jgi:MHS family proline/betaine transporter-like MFS transporter
MRPVGAIVLGRYADRHGRKQALQISLLLMTAGSLLIAITPSFATLGLAAPLIIVTARMLQGFSVGGEFGSATAFLAEQNPAHRGYFASWQFASQGIAAVLATGFGALVTSIFTEHQIADWAWRIPFIVGVAVGPVGLYIRSHLSESEEFRATAAAKPALGTVTTTDRNSFFAALGLVIFGTAATYTIIFMPTYAARHLSLPLSNSFSAGLLTGAIQFTFIPIFGALSDRIGRTPISLAAVVLTMAAFYPAFAWLAADPSIVKLAVVQSLLGIATAAYLGAIPALMADLFPSRIRGTGLSLSYAVGVAIFGGLAPFFQEGLIDLTGSTLAPAVYLICAGGPSLIALIAARGLGLR